MKKRLFLLLVALMAVGATAQAQTFDFNAASPNGQTLWYKINPDSVSVTLVSPVGSWPCYSDIYSRPVGNLIIPDTVYHGGHAYAVTAMGGEALRDCGGITALHIPATLTIGVSDYNLLCLSGLLQITVDPANPVYDSRNNCNAIIRTATNRLVLGCGSTIFPDNIDTIGSHAFYGNTNITSITIPPSVRYIDYRAFSVTHLTSVTFQGGPGADLHIGSEAFINNPYLSALNIPAHVTYIDDGMVRGDTAIVSIVVDPENQYYDSRNNCNALIETSTNRLISGCRTTVIPQSVRIIGDGAFWGHPNTAIIVPDSVYSIGWAAFADMNSLQRLVIGASVQSIGSDMLAYNNGPSGSLISIEMRCATPPTITSSTFHLRGDNPHGVPLILMDSSDWWSSVGDFYFIVPCGATGAYQTAPNWSTFSHFNEMHIFDVHVQNSNHGVVNILNAPSCTDSSALFQAVPFLGYKFSHWSDGDTTNPRTIVVDDDVIITAIFEEDNVLVTATSTDNSKGIVSGGGVVARNSLVTLTAIIRTAAQFRGWSNGVMTNPYSFFATTDTAITAIFAEFDTTYVHDTTYVNVPYAVHDTTYVNVPYPVHDTTYIDVHDTTYINVPYAVHDTTIVTDTVTLTEYVPVHDTTYIDVHDTTYIDVPYAVHDTTYIDVHDTTYIDVPYAVHDTTVVTVVDTIDNYIYDTTIVYDTTILTDTLYVFDTVYIHDTVYVGVDDVETINAKIFVNGGQIVVEGADGNPVVLFDVNGRQLAVKQDYYTQLRFDVPVAGAYLVKIGNYPARRVVVVR